MNRQEANERIAEKVFSWKRLEGAQIVEHERVMRSGSERAPDDSSRWHNRRMWIDDKGSKMACEECGDLPDYFGSADASKALRDKLAERWNYLLGLGKTRDTEPPFGFALFDKHTGKEKFITEANDEFYAVALCALRASGLADVEITNE